MQATSMALLVALTMQLHVGVVAEVRKCNGNAPCGSSCKEARDVFNVDTDGLVLLDIPVKTITSLQGTLWSASNPAVKGVVVKVPMEVYCYRMGALISNNSALAYLDVAHGDTQVQWYLGGQKFDISFSRIRVDESSLLVYSGDYTFAESTNTSLGPTCTSEEEACSQHPTNCHDGKFYAPIGTTRSCNCDMSDNGSENTISTINFTSVGAGGDTKFSSPPLGDTSIFGSQDWEDLLERKFVITQIVEKKLFDFSRLVQTVALNDGNQNCTATFPEVGPLWAPPTNDGLLRSVSDFGATFQLAPLSVEQLTYHGGWGLALCLDIPSCSGQADNCLPENCVTGVTSFIANFYASGNRRVIAPSVTNILEQTGAQFNFYKQDEYTVCTLDQVESIPATLTSDRKCIECVAGTKVVDGEDGKECQECQTGSFTNASNLDACFPHTPCDAGFAPVDVDVKDSDLECVLITTSTTTSSLSETETTTTTSSTVSTLSTVSTPLADDDDEDDDDEPSNGTTMTVSPPPTTIDTSGKTTLAGGSTTTDNEFATTTQKSDPDADGSSGGSGNNNIAVVAAVIVVAVVLLLIVLVLVVLRKKKNAAANNGGSGNKKKPGENHEMAVNAMMKDLPHLASADNKGTSLQLSNADEIVYDDAEDDGEVVYSTSDPNPPPPGGAASGDVIYASGPPVPTPSGEVFYSSGLGDEDYAMADKPVGAAPIYSVPANKRTKERPPKKQAAAPAPQADTAVYSSVDYEDMDSNS